MMRNIRLLSMVFFAIAALAPMVAAQSLERPSGDNTDALVAFDHAMAALDQTGLDSGGTAYAQSVVDIYAELRARTPAVKGLDQAQLQGVFRAIVTTIFYSNSARYLADLNAAIDELASRGLLTEVHARDARDSLMRLRAFGQIHYLAGAGVLKNDIRIPPLRFSEDFVAGRPAVIRTGMHEGDLRVVNVALDRLVVVATFGPYCMPSRRALKAIAADVELAAFFRAHALWLIPVNASLHLDRVKEVSQAAAGDVAVAYDVGSWPQIDSWSTPMFYILRDGDVVDTVRGWPSDDRLGELREKIRASRRAGAE